MGLSDAIVKRKDESVTACTLADEINREELLIGFNSLSLARSSDG